MGPSRPIINRGHDYFQVSMGQIIPVLHFQVHPNPSQDAQQHCTQYQSFPENIIEVLVQCGYLKILFGKQIWIRAETWSLEFFPEDKDRSKDQRIYVFEQTHSMVGQKIGPRVIPRNEMKALS